ncbi:hypothetical protein WJX73_008951 [Symbiochloris irregularis]|uniref:Uncharacterized protein n=1 Tax=Symbiochloris irregularis TaxID=706552 RepID=A0AAW1NMF5_9CHLO
MAGRGAEDAERPLLQEAPQRKHRSTLLTVCPFILGSEFCERLAYYGLSTNLVIYLTRVMGEEPADAAIQQMLFEGTCYLTPIWGALLADSSWGRYKTILVFSIIYLLGMVALAATAWFPGLTPGPDQDRATWTQNALLYSSLYIVALGTGGIKPNVSAFGADQFDEGNEQDCKEKRSFFNWFYFAINLGSLLACTVVVYIQDSLSWAIGFAIPAVAMAIAIAVFVGGGSLYTHVVPTQSPMTRVVKVLWAAAKRKRKRQHAGAVQQNGHHDLSLAAAMRKTHSYEWLQNAVVDHASLAAGEQGQEGGLAGFTAEQVEEVHAVVRMLPIFFTTVLYWTIYAQMGSFFVEQGAVMDRMVYWKGHEKFDIPAASLAVFNTLSIIILIPIYDRGLVPLLRRLGCKISHLQRIGWGLFVCVLAMLAAALVEVWRLRLFKEGQVIHESSIFGLGHGSRIVDISVFWQTLQYLLVGLSEVLASIALSQRLGLNEGQGWLTQDLNYGRLDLFFCLLAGLMLLNLAVFVWVASRYRYKQIPHGLMRAPSMPAPQEQSSLPPPHPHWARAQPVTGTSPFPRTPEITIGGAAHRPTDDVGLYGRSVTYRPDSLGVPAHLR